MSSASQVLPSLLCLAFGGAGFLWLSEPTASGAAEQTLLEPAPPILAFQAARAVRPEAGVEERLDAMPARTSFVPNAAPADPIDPAQLAELRLRLKQEKQRRRDLQQIEREREEDLWLRTRAGQVASELQLPSGSGTSLAAVLIEERDKQSACWSSVRTCGSTQEARQRLREEMTAIRAWRGAELTRVFGAETAKRIEAAVDGAEGKAP